MTARHLIFRYRFCLGFIQGFNMVIMHSRTQRPVGQGFFHTAMVLDAKRAFRYVYDCGAMPKYRRARSDAISAYRLSHEGAGSLDILFLSHAHADHINGVKQLLKGWAVDTIMLPLLSVQERVIAFAQSATEAPVSARDPFYRDFIIDPAVALARFGPRQILFVKRGAPEEGAPGRDGEEIGPYDGAGDQIAGAIPDDARRVPWKLVGRGRAEDRATVNASSKKKSATSDSATIPDSRAIAVGLEGNPNPWLLAPYVDPGIIAGRNAFFKKLRAKPGFDRRSLVDAVRLTEILSHKEEVAILVDAYKSLGRDLNLTSLCLYSGPAQTRRIQSIQLICATKGGWRLPAERHRIAWLATGDAALKETRRVNNFAAHFGLHLEKVSTMTLPHHGSDNNSGDELLDRVKPCDCVVSADRYSTWQHPGSEITYNLASRGIPMAMVTSDRTSEYRQFACSG
jgi:hypothetical protein